ncbi:hypothetical protein EON65_29685 [archaeon]|nr:MAG: hypothetical protein EON65_29685 [archaeon]
MSENKNKAGFPSDDDLASAANEVLLASDPYTISAKQIRLQLEEKFGCELTTKKDLLRTIIENFLVDRRSESEKEDEKQEAASSGKAKKPVGKGFGSVLYTSQLANFMQKDSGTRTEVGILIKKILYTYMSIIITELNTSSGKPGDLEIYTRAQSAKPSGQARNRM